MGDIPDVAVGLPKSPAFPPAIQQSAKKVMGKFWLAIAAGAVKPTDIEPADDAVAVVPVGEPGTTVAAVSGIGGV